MLNSRRIRTALALALMCSACAPDEGDMVPDGEWPDEATQEAAEEVADSEADESDDVELGRTSQALQLGPNDVGVLQSSSTLCWNEQIMLTLENERENNGNARDGWFGASTQWGGYTKFHFCRMDGRLFRPARGTSSNLNYAVLKLGATCPAGSVELDRYFDNEDRPRTCPSWPWACGVGKPETRGDYAPSYYSANNLHMKLCVFRASSTGSLNPLPPGDGNNPYGVFGTPSLPHVIASGWVFTDDENDSNANDLTGGSGWSSFLTATHNTSLSMVQVRPPSRVVVKPLDPVFDAAQ